MSFQASVFPEFSWSQSRDRTLSGCARAYRHAYYTSHGGWSGEAGAMAQAAYRLKQLTTLDMALGTAIHERAREMASAIRADHAPPSLDVLRQRTRRALNSLVTTSREREAFLHAPRRVAMLMESYYGRPLSRQLIERISERLERCLYFLHISPLWSELRALPASGVILIDSLAGFDFDGVTLYAAPDLIYGRHGVWTIVDWKTGSPGDAVEQLAVYALYVERALHVSEADGRFLGRVITLADGHDETYSLGRDAIECARQRIRASIATMRTLLVDEVRNAPKDIGAFPLTSDPRLCRYCRYLELCRDELRTRMCEGVEQCVPQARPRVDDDLVA